MYGSSERLISNLARPLVLSLARLAQRVLFRIARRRGTRQDASHFASLAWRELAAGHLVSGLHFAQAARACDPSYPDAYRMMGLAHARSGHRAEARAAYDAGLQVDPHNLQLLVYTGDLDFDMQRYDAAEARYQHAVDLGRLDPELPDLLLKLALARFKQGRLDEAAATLDEARRLAPDHARVLAALGEVRLWQRDYGRAVQVFRTAIGRDPGLARAHYGLAYGLAGLARWREALVAVRHAIVLDPNEASFRALLARLGEHLQAEEPPGAPPALR